VHEPPDDLAVTDVTECLAAHWGQFGGVSLEHVPRGAGSHHWVATTAGGSRCFVTVDDLDTKRWISCEREASLLGLQAAYGAAAVLRDVAGLEFVLAPCRTVAGDLLVRIAPAYTVSVFPWIDGRAGAWGEKSGVASQPEVLGLLAALHETRTPTDLGLSRQGTEGQGQGFLRDALATLDDTWVGGPFSEPARQLTRANAERLMAWLTDYERGSILESAIPNEDLVITHGEPHPGNLMRGEEGLLLIDWDTAGLAPRERDLWMLDDGVNGRFGAYEKVTGTAVRPEGLAFYRLGWSLMDIGDSLQMFRSPHSETSHMSRAWSTLVDYLGAGQARPWGPLS
jgi:spectinomycin phosphotransferase